MDRTGKDRKDPDKESADAGHTDPTQPADDKNDDKKREEASKRADAGGAPEQSDTGPEGLKKGADV